MTFTARWLSIVAAVLLIVCAAVPQTHALSPGVERWAVKTSLAVNHSKKKIPIDELLALPDPVDRNTSQYDSVRIPFSVGPHKLREGQLVTTTAWLHLVALEDDNKTHRDGDYHIQIRNTADWADSCLVIEVPLPDFVPDTALASRCREVRQFIRDKLLNGHEPGTKGNKLDHPVLVTVTGQLFFDLPHVTGNPRGKRNMRSYTPWELHPIIAIKFAPKPN